MMLHLYDAIMQTATSLIMHVVAIKGSHVSPV